MSELMKLAYEEKGFVIWRVKDAPDYLMKYAPNNGEDITYVVWMPASGPFPPFITPRNQFGNGFVLAPITDPAGFIGFGTLDD